MNTSITPFQTIAPPPPRLASTSPPTNPNAAVSQSRASAPEAASPAPATVATHGNLEKDIAIDTSGIVIVKTIDPKSSEILSQAPTEAYLRLAHAMSEAVQAETRGEPTSDVLA